MYLKRYFPLMLVMVLLLSACAPTATEVVELPQETTIDPVVSTIPTQLPETTPFTLAVYDENTLDPAWTEYRANLTLAPLLYEGLFQLNNQFQPQPLLSTSYTTSGDGLIWTYTLQSGVTFSDGTPLTGTLVADSLQTSAASGSRYASRLSNITGFSGDETTVTLTLSTPNTNLPALLDVPITLQSDDPLHPLGTGAYTYTSAALIPRSDYWQSTALQTAELPLHAIRYTDDLASAFDAGYISLVDVDLLGTQAPYFSTSYEVWDYPTTSMIYLAFNTLAKETLTVEGKVDYYSPCSSAQLRRIVAMAVDRTTIVSGYFAQRAVASTLPIHPSATLYDAILAATGDPFSMLTSAVSELTPLDTPLRLITANENAAKLSTAQLIVDNLNNAGIETQLVSLSWDDYIVALETGDFDIYLAETQLTADFDLSPLIATQGTLNYGGYTSISTDELLSNLRSATTSAQPTAAALLYTHILEQTPIVPICFKNNSVLSQWGRISQLIPTQSNIFYNLKDWIFSDTAVAP